MPATVSSTSQPEKKKQRESNQGRRESRSRSRSRGPQRREQDTINFQVPQKDTQRHGDTTGVQTPPPPPANPPKRDELAELKRLNAQLLAEIKQQQENFILLSDPHTPTRMGSSVSKDTFPDLSITTGNVTVMWSHTGENLGVSGATQYIKDLETAQYLMDPSKSNTESNQTMEKIIRYHPGDAAALMKSLLDKYLPVHPKTPLPPYSGQPNLKLDEDI
ncbi:hypothetical protein HPB48_003727 [Haemaphysalis longicornis]|uniref:Uncharacterized protein n=1 Tax=Haemaphysalis longicornis TaxID=44386 RepID=A0A9J6FHE8_HAELO|nr:hypothetical protein HPB48_003727 [Haemaphysalis longicornis]